MPPRSTVSGRFVADSPLSRERLLSRSMPVPFCGCWIWLGASKPPGDYGFIKINKVQTYAHRASYEAFKGPIPDGLDVLHACDVPPCINPDHLFLGTQQDNMDDMIAKGRKVAKPGSTHWKSKLTEADIPIIRRRRASGEKLQDIADDYGMKMVGIHNICSRKNWGHVP